MRCRAVDLCIPSIRIRTTSKPQSLISIGIAKRWNIRVKIRKWRRLNEPSYTRRLIKLQEDESGVTNEAIVTAKPDAPKCMPPRTGLSGGLVWPCVWLRVASLTGLFMRQKPARIKSCAVEDVRRLCNFLLARFVSAGDEERLMHEDDSLLRGSMATLLPPPLPPPRLFN